MTDKLRQAAQQALEKIAKAHTKVDALCLGHERWTMSVPVRPDHDHDLVISGALYAAAEFIRAALAEQPAEQEPVACDVTKEMIGAAHDVLLKRGMVLSYEIMTEIYKAMDQAAPTLKTPFDTCPTCEALARSVMLNQSGSDSDWEHVARLLDAALQELVVFVDERWGDNECRPLENAKHAIGLVKDEQ